MADIKEYFEITTPVVSIWPNVVTPAVYQEKGKPVEDGKFSNKFLFEPDAEVLAAAKRAAAAVAAARWPGRDFSTLKFPFESGTKIADAEKAKGDKGKDREFMRGKVVLTARTKFEPGLAAVVGNDLVDFEGATRPAAKPYFYSGVETLGAVQFEAYDGKAGNPDGITARLKKVVSLNKGERIAA